VWSWRPDAGAKCAGSIPRMTVARKPGHRGELEVSRKTTAQGEYRHKKTRYINALTPLCPHLCRDPVTIRLRKIYERLSSPVDGGEGWFWSRRSHYDHRMTNPMSKILLALLTFAIFFLETAAAWSTCDQTTAKRVASQVTSDFATLVHFTKAACVSATEGQQCSLACFSDLYISGDNRNLVLFMITASAGKRMRDAGISKFSQIAFADRELLLARKALALSASMASQLQQTFSPDSKEPPLKMAARIAASYTMIEIPNKK
jgi:hypothetical protein